MGQPRYARAFGFVDAWQVWATDQQVNAGCAVFQRGACAVHGRCTSTYHADAQALELGIVQLVGRVCPAMAVYALQEGWHLCAAQTVTAGGQHYTACTPGAALCGCLHVHFDHAIGLRANGQHLVLIAHIGLRDAAVPAQVVHPLQAWNLVERLPGGFAPLRDEPGAKTQRRQAEGRAQQFLGGAQCFHARGGGPWAFKVLRGAV